jgi:hypothetical protein
MSGGGGGGNKKSGDGKGTTPGGSSLPAYGNAPTTQTFQPMMPGFQNMLANQLSAGFGSGGGGAPDFAAMLSGMYSPMSLVNFQEPISTTASLYDKKKFAPISTGNVTLDKLLMGEKVGEDGKDKK